MSTYQKAPQEVLMTALGVITQYHPEWLQKNPETGESELSLKIDILMAYGERDEETDKLKSPALKQYGMSALGLTRIIPLKERAKGNGDVEICLDADWWEKAPESERAALLDHELTHIRVMDRTDDLGRPVIKLRKHDIQVGWFNIVAQRHGAASQERIQARQIVEVAGQLYFPELEGLKQSESRFAKLEVRTTNGKDA